MHTPERVAPRGPAPGTAGHHHRRPLWVHLGLERIHLRPDFYLHHRTQDRDHGRRRRSHPGRFLLLGLADGRGAGGVTTRGLAVRALFRSVRGRSYRRRTLRMRRRRAQACGTWDQTDDGGVRMKISRRKFIKVAGGVGLAVAAGSIRWPQHVTAGSPTTLRVLGHSAFNEDSDKAIITIGNDLARQHNATFAGDFIDQPEVAAKLTAEEQAKAGHDIVDLQDNLPTIHKDYLVPLDDVVADITGKFGPFYQVAKDSGYVAGHWLTLPWIGNGTLGVYRADYFAAVGEQPSASWDDLLRAATKLKKAGHPVGLPISQCEDADSIFFPLLWSFGGSVADAKNKLTLDSPQTRAALNYMRKLFAEMDATVLSWDDSGNNKHLLSGRGSYTINAPSIYLRARREKMPFAASVR